MTESQGQSFDRRAVVNRLKSETSEQHQRLEDLIAIDRPDLDLDRYRSVLRLLYGFYAPWEQRYIPALEVEQPAFWEQRMKTPHLACDLQFLQIDPECLPSCPFIPDFGAIPQVLGSSYVLEGASLGGQVISRMLERNFSFSEGRGYSFFKGYGPQTGSMWRAFQDVLVSHANAQTELPMVTAAQSTFSALYEWMAGGLN